MPVFAILLNIIYKSITEHALLFRKSDSVFIFSVSVFSHCLPIMTSFAQRLPVVTIPKEFLISSVWHNMVYYGCLNVPAFLHALRT